MIVALVPVYYSGIVNLVWPSPSVSVTDEFSSVKYTLWNIISDASRSTLLLSHLAKRRILGSFRFLALPMDEGGHKYCPGNRLDEFCFRGVIFATWPVAF